MNERSAFQARLFAALVVVMERFNISPTVREVPNRDNSVCLLLTFKSRGVDHSIEIYEDSAVMLANGKLYEAYMRDEFRDLDTLAESFAGRVARYLSTGEWRRPDEVSLLTRLRRWMKGAGD